MFRSKHVYGLSICAALWVGLMTAGTATASVAITEVVGNTSDADLEWFELFNYGPDPVSLDGWQLQTDNGGSNFEVPTGIVIPSGGFVIIADHAKTTFEIDWLGGTSDSRVYESIDAFDIDNSNEDNLSLLSPINDDEAWRVVTPSAVFGNSTYYANDDFTVYKHGEEDTSTNPATWYPINNNGVDSETGLDPGYESNDNTPDPLATTSLSGTTGSPLDGDYTAATRTVISITDPTGAYMQDFDTLGGTDGTGYDALSGSAPLPDGWRTFEADGGFNSSYRAEDGDNGSGEVLSLGDDGDTDRALGTLRTGSNFGMYIGAVFRNDTSEDITSIEISFTGEQWRIGADRGFGDLLDFAYALDALNLYTGDYVDIDALDLMSPTIGAGDTQLDGNLAENQVDVGPVVIHFATAVAPGEEFWIRWFDVQVSGSDDQLGIDDLVVRFNPSVATIPAPAALPAGLMLITALVGRRRR